jgi:hypothetical protein
LLYEVKKPVSTGSLTHSPVDTGFKIGSLIRSPVTKKSKTRMAQKKKQQQIAPEASKIRHWKGGRPPKQADECSSKRIMLYLTQTEYNRLKEIKNTPGSTGKSLNELLKNRLLNPSRSPATDSSIVLMSLLLSIDANRVQLKRIGVNLNQLVHRINSIIFPRLINPELKNVLDLYPQLLALIDTEKSIFLALEEQLTLVNTHT